MRLPIKESWEGATGGWGADNRRARRINRKRLRRQAVREVAEQLDPQAPFERCSSCGERFCDGCGPVRTSCGFGGAPPGSMPPCP